MDLSVEVGSLVVAVIAAWSLPWQISRTIRKEREHEAARTLELAKQADDIIKSHLEAKIQNLEMECRNLKENVEKDFSHVRETYSGELANISKKVEELREELRTGHSQLVSLLTEMIRKQ